MFFFVMMGWLEVDFLIGVYCHVEKFQSVGVNVHICVDLLLLYVGWILGGMNRLRIVVWLSNSCLGMIVFIGLKMDCVEILTRVKQTLVY